MVLLELLQMVLLLLLALLLMVLVTALTLMLELLWPEMETHEKEGPPRSDF